MSKGPWIIASYDGKCSECSGPIEAGDQIRADGDGGWIGECCDDGDDTDDWN